MESINESGWSFPAVEDVWSCQLCCRRGCENSSLLFFLTRLNSTQFWNKTTRKFIHLSKLNNKNLVFRSVPTCKVSPKAPLASPLLFFFISQSVFLSRLLFHHMRHLLQSASPGVVLVLHHTPHPANHAQRPRGCQILK